MHCIVFCYYPEVLFQEEAERISLDGGSAEVVDRFSYLGDVLSAGGRSPEVLTSKI